MQYNRGYRHSDSRGPPTGPRVDRLPQQTRPQGHNEQPRPIMVTTNCFRITKLPTAEYVMLDVNFAPESGKPIPKEHANRKEALVRHMQVMVAPEIFTVPLLYDGGAIAYAHPKIRDALESVQTFRVHLGCPKAPPPEIRNAVIIKLSPTKAAPIVATEINEVIVHGKDSPRKTELLNFMQLIVRQATNNEHANNGRAYFPERSLSFPGYGHLELRTGIFHSVRPAINHAVVVVDTSVGIFFKRVTLIDALLAFFSFRDIRQLGQLEKRRFESMVHAFKNVFVRESKGNPSVKGGRRKIKGFHPDGAKYQFENDDGTVLTIEQHYQRVHNMRLRFPNLPGIILATKPKLIIVPMENCVIEPNQFCKKDLGNGATAEIMSVARLEPHVKMKAIMEGARQYQAAQALNFSGMEVESNPLDVPAVIKPPPQVQYGSSIVLVREGKWNLIRQKVLTPARECQWAILNLAPTRIQKRDLARHIGAFVGCARTLGLTMHGDPVVEKSADLHSLIKTLEDLEQDVKKKLGAEVFDPSKSKFFVLCILEKDALEPRSILKHWGDVKKGVVTQCVCVDKIARLNDRGGPQYWSNVALKLNPRLGGENSRVTGCNVMLEFTKKRNVTMIVGADVGHPGCGISKPSTAALVYNTNPYATNYAAISRLQDPRQEIIADLQSMMRAAMENVMRFAGDALKNVVFFRDGVSEGEYDIVKQVEVKAITSAIDEVWNTLKFIVDMANKGTPFPKPKLTYIVVGKRHHTILFPQQRMAGERIGNCPAGVVVNQRITQPTIKDFYLLSHAAIIGTSRSSHYIVLQDEVFEGDTSKIEELAYALCHVYAKATRSVSIPAPVYYADLVCGRDSYHFAPGAEQRLRAGSTFGTASPDDSSPFDIQPWNAAYEPPHPHMRRNMYFL